jgi:hypothetical protein
MADRAALYYNVTADMVTKFEYLLTAIELSVNEYQLRSFISPSSEIFDSIDTLSRQTIILRRRFWHVRSMINFLVHIIGLNLNNLEKLPTGFLIVVVSMTAIGIGL